MLVSFVLFCVYKWKGIGLEMGLLLKKKGEAWLIITTVVDS